MQAEKSLRSIWQFFRADRGEHRGHLISRELREKKEKCGEKLHDIWKGRSPACRPVHPQLVDRFSLLSALVREGGIVGDEHQFRYRRAISGMVDYRLVEKCSFIRIGSVT